MSYFDFHHHQPEKNGIYNLDYQNWVYTKYFSIGLHPKDISANWKEDFEIIKKHAQNEQCIALGECGLDGLINTSTSLQEEVFNAHIEWANQIKKPIIIHCVRRHSELLKYTKRAETAWIIHGFNKKKQIAHQLLEHGFYFSFGKAALLNVSLQQLIIELPVNKIFLETDNANFNISNLYDLVSQLKGISMGKLQNQISENLESIRSI